MKKSKDELLSAIDSLQLDDDSKIALMEDIADSLDVGSEDVDSIKSELENLKSDVEMWKDKYKKRFLNIEEIEEKEDIEEPDEEEKKIIDVKEI